MSETTMFSTNSSLLGRAAMVSENSSNRKEIPMACRHYDRLGIRSSSLGGTRRSSPGATVADSASSVAAARRVSKKYKSTREYLRLKAILPSVSSKKTVSKLTVIEEAIRYIDHLHATLAARMTTDGVQPIADTTAGSSSTVPEEFVRRLCFGLFLSDRPPAESASDLVLRRTAIHNERRPLVDRTPLIDSRSRNTPSSGPIRNCISSIPNR